MNRDTDIDRIMERASVAFGQYKKTRAIDRATFLRTIAAQIDELGDELIFLAMEETNLPEARLKNERGRTTNQLHAFAQLIEAGHWVEASIDTGNAERKPAPKPDIRKMLFPLGPVVVFGASNFPFAFSTAGGDTASALAAGCPVTVKSHPGHPRTSVLVAQAIARAVKKCSLPPATFQHVDDASQEAGQKLVLHPLTKAASFTGSYAGGKALFELANGRKEPIPFFAEMGSINPVVVLPEIIRQNQALPAQLAASIILGAGQFCTNPGLLLVLEGDELAPFLDKLTEQMEQATPAKMLHPGIARGYAERKKEALVQQGVVTLVEVQSAGSESGSAALGMVRASYFIQNPTLREEVFGPYSLLVKCATEQELLEVIGTLSGQLTATVFGLNEELLNSAAILEALQQRCGRLICNGVPTGVEVTKAMHHGGPFPATTDARFTSVGTDAIYRFVRPVCYQDFPDELLPIELRNSNELAIWRSVDGEWTQQAILQAQEK